MSQKVVYIIFFKKQPDVKNVRIDNDQRYNILVKLKKHYFYYIFFIFSVNGKKYVASVKCTKSKCSPKIAGPSNACMYICGKIEC